MEIQKAYKRIQERFEKYDDQAICEKMAEFATKNPTTIVTTNKGVEITVARRVTISKKVEYEAHIQGIEERVAWMYTGMIIGGRLQVTNANVYVVDEVDYKRMGIATALYDLIEADLKAAGGEMVEPQFGAMSDHAKEFWKQRRPEYADKIEELNKMGTAASGLFD